MGCYVSRVFSHILTASALSATVASIPLTAYSQLSQECKPIAYSLSAGPNWNDDTAYEISVSHLPSGKSRVTIVGDIIFLDRANFASLIRDVDQAPASVSEIIFDAREVRLLEPLSFQNARIEINSYLFSIEGKGKIALTRDAGEQTEGLEINAWRVDLSRASPIPIQITLRNQTGRGIIVNARELITKSGTLSGEAAAGALWRRTSNHNGLPRDGVPEGWRVDIGESGLASAVAAQSGSVNWPLFFSYKIRKHHAIAPFDEANRKSLGDRISWARGVIEDLGSAEAILSLDAISALMRENIDSRGMGPAYVPSADFVTALENFRVKTESTEGQLHRLASMIIRAHNAPALDEAALETTRARRQSVDIAIETKDRELGEVFTRLSQLEVDANIALHDIEVERLNSARELEELRARDNDLANIRAVTTVVAVGASFIGTPAVGAAIATGVSAAGDLVYAHNSGAPQTLETLVTIGQKNATFYASIHKARSSWETHRKDVGNLRDVFSGKEVVSPGAGKPMTREDAAKRTASSAGELAGAINSVVSGIGSLPKPDSVELNDVEAMNVGLQSALARLADIHVAISVQTQKLSDLHLAVTASRAERAEIMIIEDDLLALNTANDRELLRWKAAGLQLWNVDLRTRYREAMDLRRSLLFETGKIPHLPREMEAYPEEMTAYLAAGRYDPLAPDSTGLAEITEAHLNAEASKHVGILKAIHNAIELSWEEYKNERAAGARSYLDYTEFSSRETAPPTDKLFLDQLNAQIRRQVLHPERRIGFPLLIPIRMNASDMGPPERLLDAGIANVEFRDSEAMTGKSIEFNIEYLLKGESYRDGVCSLVDISTPGGSKTSRIRNQARPLSIIESADRNMTFQDLTLSRTAPPSATLYFLSVTVGGSSEDGNWTKIPEIEKFTFWRRMVQ